MLSEEKCQAGMRMLLEHQRLGEQKRVLLQHESYQPQDFHPGRASCALDMAIKVLLLTGAQVLPLLRELQSNRRL